MLYIRYLALIIWVAPLACNPKLNDCDSVCIMQYISSFQFTVLFTVQQCDMILKTRCVYLHNLTKFSNQMS